MKNTTFSGIATLVFASTLWSGPSLAQDDGAKIMEDTSATEAVFDGRFYLTPMGSWSFGEDDSDFDLSPDDGGGGHLIFGKPLNEYIAVELFGSFFGAVDLERTITGDVDMLEFGLSGLLFPIPDSAPVFVLASVGLGDYDFTLTNIPGLDGEFDGVMFDLGFGYLLPLSALGIPDNYGFALRMEYRFRHSDLDDVPGGVEFDNQIVSLGLQIPLGSAPDAAPVIVAAPATDSDGDGVIDPWDDCPGTRSGAAVNNRGCEVTAQTAAPAEPEVVVLPGTNFQFDSASLSPAAEEQMADVAQALRDAGNVEVLVAGHTDSVGSASYNLGLSQARANSVKTYLVDHGIDPDRLTTIGYGETRPVATNDTAAGRAMNRRVELHITSR